MENTLDNLLNNNNDNIVSNDNRNDNSNESNDNSNDNIENNDNETNDNNNINKKQNAKKTKKKNCVEDGTSNIDKILNNSLIKFDNNKIQKSMFFVCHKSIDAFCNNLKKTYNITIPQEFIDEQIINNIPNLIKEYTSNLKKRCKKYINIELICLGRKLDGKQCTRKKYNENEFCKSHLNKLSNGRIDEAAKLVIKNKRGRKRKIDFDPRQYDNEYITLWEDIISGERVLIDNNNNIYTFDIERPQYIGKKSITNKIDIVSILKEIKQKSSVIE